MPQASSLAPSLLVAALTMFAPAQAQEVSSLYTPLDLKKCKDVTPTDAKEYGTIWRCEGYEELSVRVAEGDLRIFVSYGPKAETQTAAPAAIQQYRRQIGVARDERRRPVSSISILRYKWDSDNGEGSTLVVTKLGRDDSCHVAYVDATGNPKANEQARAIADREAVKFVCKQDTAKHYLADGSAAQTR